MNWLIVSLVVVLPFWALTLCTLQVSARAVADQERDAPPDEPQSARDNAIFRVTLRVIVAMFIGAGFAAAW